MLVVVLVLENPDRFAIRLTEQISCRTSVSLRSRNPNAPRTSTTTRTRTIPNFGIWTKPKNRCGRPIQPMIEVAVVALFAIGLRQADAR